MHQFEVLRRPLITEKNTIQQAAGKYAFDVKVTKVNIMIVHGKMKRMGKRAVLTPSWKKAIVTLKPGDTIQLFEGV